MCFSGAWLINVLVWLIVIGAIVAIFRIVLPYVLAQLGVAGGMVMQIINVIIIAVVLIFVLYLAWDLLTCFTFPRVR